MAHGLISVPSMMYRPAVPPYGTRFMYGGLPQSMPVMLPGNTANHLMRPPMNFFPQPPVGVRQQHALGPVRGAHMPPNHFGGIRQQPYDEYAGLLTKSEKEWLNKIQMLQLHSDNPYADDFYYTIHSLEKAMKGDPDDIKRSNNLIVPALAKVDSKENREYKPLQFEGSLGKLTSYSVHKPRQILDVGNKDEQQILHVHTVDSRKFRQTLHHIEKGHDIILEIDENQKKMQSLPSEQRSELESSCFEKANMLYHVVEENWMSLLNVRKGRSLILRIIPVLKFTQAKALMDRILTNVNQFLKKEAIDPVELKSVRCMENVTSHCDLLTLLSFTKKLEPILASALNTSFGCWLVVLLIKQAENIYSAFVEVGDKERQEWSKFVDSVLEVISNSGSLPPLKSVPLAVYDHMSRRPHSPHMLQKISLWFT